MTTRLMRRLKQTFIGELAALVGPYVLARWKLLFGSTLAVITATGADLLRPWPLKFVFDYLLKDVNFLPAGLAPESGDPRTWMLVAVCALILVVWILSSVAAYFGSYLSDRLAEEAEVVVRGHVRIERAVLW